MRKGPDCYRCKYRRDVPGDAHSSCDHPEVGGLGGYFQALARVLSGRYAGAAAALEIKGPPHGIAHGWFFWPANFDPVWLESCNGFTEK